MGSKLESDEKKIERLTKAIEDNPKDGKIYNYRGNLFVKLKQYEKAINDFNKSVTLEPGNAKAHYNKGLTLANLQRDEEALQSYDKAIELKFQNFNIYFNRGNTLINLKRYEEAIQSYDKAIGLNPRKEIAYNNKGNALYDLERYKEALLNYNKAIEIAPQRVNAYNNKGLVLVELKQYKEALQYYNKAIEIDPQNISSYFNRGNALAVLGRYTEALNDFNEVIKLNPKDTCAFYFIGITCFMLKKWRKAAITFIDAKKDILDILTLFNEAREVEHIVSFMIDLNQQDFFNKTINTSENTRAQYKSIYIIILQIIYLLHIKNKNEVSFAHYTKRSTTALLLFEDSKFRLNSTITANDPQEGKTLIEYLFNKEYLSKEGKGTDKKEHSHDYQAFIGCFTFNLESLNQFRLYGKEANKEATGISLILNKRFFNEKIDIGLLSSCHLTENVSIKNDKLQKYALFRCIYIDPVTHKIVSLGHREDNSFYTEKEDIPEVTINEYKEEIKNTQKKVEELFNKLSAKVNNSNLDKDIVCELLLPLRYLVKHVAFKEEQECRIFDIKDLQEERLKQEEDREVKFTPDYSQMYIEYQPITEEHLQEVIFAPKARGIEIFKKAAEQKGLAIECKMSTHPFS